MSDNPYEPPRDVKESPEPGKPLSGGRPTNVRWLILSLACGTSWFLYLHRYTWNFIRPELEKEYGFSNTQLEGIYTVFNFSYGAGQVPSGILCDMFGPHLFLVAIILLWSLALPTFGLTGNVYGLGGLRLLFGATQAGCYPSLSNVTKNWFPRSSRTIIQGLVASLFGRSGGAMSSIIMGALLMGYFGLSWRWALVIMGLTGALFAGVFLMFYRNRPDDDPRVNQAERDLIHEGEVENPNAPRVLPFGRVLRNRSMLIFIFQQFMNAGADFIYVSTMGSYFITARNFSVTTAGLLVSLPLWGGALGGVVGGFINDGLIRMTGSRRWSRSAVGFTGKLLAAGFMFVAIGQTSGLMAAIFLFVVKFFGDWTQPTVWGTCTDMGGRYSATVFSVINTAGSAGGLVTPLVVGVLLDYFSTTQIVDGVQQTVTNYNPMFILVAVMYLLSACCWFFIDCTQSLDIADEPTEADAE